MISARNFFRGVKEYSLITIGLLLYVVGWCTFLLPNNLIGGGVTGLSSIVQYATGIKVGYTYFAVNIVLLIWALFTLGKGFGTKTVYAIFIVSIGLNVFQDIIPYEIIDSLAIKNGKLMSTIMGGILSGIGIGVSMSQGGSTGGTDIVALIVNKYRNVSPGKVILILDFFIISSSMLVPSYTSAGELVPLTDKITVAVYALILVVITSTVVDLYLSGSKQSVQLFILSKKYEELADGIIKDLDHGVTVLDGKGWYTKEKAQVLMVIVRKTDLNIVLRYIKSIDPDVFMSVSSVTGVYGKGFETIRYNNKKKKLS